MQPAMPANDQAGAIRRGDGIAPVLLLNDGGQELDLVGAVLVRVDRVWLESGRGGETGVGAVDGNAHAREGGSTSPQPPRSFSLASL